MSATANLFVPENAGLEGELEFSSPMMAAGLRQDEARQPKAADGYGPAKAGPVAAK